VTTCCEHAVTATGGQRGKRVHANNREPSTISRRRTRAGEIIWHNHYTCQKAERQSPTTYSLGSPTGPITFIATPFPIHPKYYHSSFTSIHYSYYHLTASIKPKRYHPLHPAHNKPKGTEYRNTPLKGYTEYAVKPCSLQPAPSTTPQPPR
jgi:hypothetical protein